jgi:hypothetical protein
VLAHKISQFLFFFAKLIVFLINISGFSPVSAMRPAKIEIIDFTFGLSEFITFVT